MKIAKATLTVVTMLALIVASGSVLARSGGHGGGRSGGHFSGSHGFHGSHFASRARVGIFVGAPFGYYAPYYYYPPYYPPVVAAPYAPPVYVEQGNLQPAPAQQGYWHYCASSQAYYPYVKECAEDWQLVSPQPPPG